VAAHVKQNYKSEITATWFNQSINQFIRIAADDGNAGEL